MVTKKKIRTPGAPPPYLGRSPKLIHFFGVASLSREWPRGRIAFPNLLCKHILYLVRRKRWQSSAVGELGQSH